MSNDPTKFTIADLRLSFDIIERQLVARGDIAWKITEERYWEVFFEEQFDLSKIPELVVGDLQQDMAFLEKDELATAGTASYISKFASILRYVAAQM